MPKLAPNTVTVLDGDVRLYKRKRSRLWQATFKMGGRWKHVTTKCKQLADAKKRARELYYEYQAREKNGLPIISKRFADVAKVVIADMDKQVDAGAGKKSYRDYKIVLEKYLIPFFGDKFVTSITYEELQKFAKWRTEKMGREPKASTLNTHNSALNRVFDEAVAQGYMNRTHVPALVNKGRDSERRPDFRREEYRTMLARFPSWINDGREGKSRDMRHLLRDYVLILANTGIRHGTEAENLRWKHIDLFEENGLKYLEMHVDGKTGPRDLMCRANTIGFLKRLQSRSPDIADLSFEELMKKRVDEPVFRLPDGTVTKNLRQTFKKLMDDTGLLVCPRTGKHRTLYSLRHTYATFALLNDGMDVHTLAVQMGTSIQMIEKHYSHLTPRLRKDMLTGKRYDLSDEEYQRKFDKEAMAVDKAAIDRSVAEVDELEEDLPNSPDVEASVGAGEPSTDSNRVGDVPKPSERSKVDRLFDLFEAGKLSEETLLAVLGVDRDGYAPNELTTDRALRATENGFLGEAGLLKILR